MKTNKQFLLELDNCIDKIAKIRGYNSSVVLAFRHRLEQIGQSEEELPGGGSGFSPIAEKHLYAIREHLEIRGNISIDYQSFIKDTRYLNHLISDNLRMENVFSKNHDEDKSELESKGRFKLFCKYAFMQIEALLSYYYKIKLNYNPELFNSHFSVLNGKMFEIGPLRPNSNWDIEGQNATLKLKMFLNIETDTQYGLLFRLIPIRNIRNWTSHSPAHLKSESGEVGDIQKELIDNHNQYDLVRSWLIEFVELIKK